MNSTELADFLLANPRAKIAIFNLGENMGMDLAYFCHYHTLRQLFPDITLDLFRSNVDETNCIGFELIDQYVETPLSRIQMAVVRQRYQPDGRDWLQKLQNCEKIFPEQFYRIEDYDLIWGIGIGGLELWLKQLPTKPTIDSSTIKAAVEEILQRNSAAKKSVATTDAPGISPRKIVDPAIRGATTIDRPIPPAAAPQIKPWERTALEYLQFDNPAYPIKFKPEFDKHPLAANYRDHLRISLRWPDYVRWYYGIERQYDLVRAIIGRINAAGKPVRLIYNLKDGEVGNNFERGQTLDKLAEIKRLCSGPGDDLVFTYSWTQNPYFMRPSEAQERAKLRSLGVPDEKILRLNLWEDLLQSKSCRTYLSDPGGFAEAISMLRPADGTFLLPVSWHHAGTYATMDDQNQPIRAKINPVCFEQCYECTPTVIGPDDKGPRRVDHWDVRYGDHKAIIGKELNGNDHEFFAAAQDGVYREWFDRSAPQLIEAVVKSYLGG